MFSAWRPIALALPLIALLAIIVMFFGIRDDPSSQKVAARLSDTHDVRLIGGDRPATLAMPFGYDAAKPILLVVSLHAYGSNAWKHDQYLRLSQAASLEGAAILLPQGLKDADGKRFWNATDWCCDFAQTGVDDVAYLRALIQEAETIIAIDRVAVVGHSNGGFMAWRLACEGVPKLAAIASIASIAGASAAEPPECEGAALVSALHLHVRADEDELVRYSGANGEDDYAGAVEAMRRWAARAECDIEPAESQGAGNLERDVSGAVVSTHRWEDGCAGPSIIEIWTIDGGDDSPDFDETIGARLVGWLKSAPAAQ